MFDCQLQSMLRSWEAGLRRTELRLIFCTVVMGKTMPCKLHRHLPHLLSSPNSGAAKEVLIVGHTQMLRLLLSGSAFVDALIFATAARANGWTGRIPGRFGIKSQVLIQAVGRAANKWVLLWHQNFVPLQRYQDERLACHLLFLAGVQ